MIAEKIAKYYKKITFNLPVRLIFLKIIWKVIKKIKDVLYHLHFGQINLSPKGDQDFISKVVSKTISVNMKEIGPYKELVSEKVINYKWLCNLSGYAEQESIRQTIKNKLLILNNADRCCLHNFNILGSGEVSVSYNTKPRGLEGKSYEMSLAGNQANDIKRVVLKTVNKVYKDQNNMNDYDYMPIDWQLDFKSGFRWDNNTWYKNIKFGHKEGADIKVPWELSRCYHFVSLGQAYLLTKDKKYAREFIYQTIDWIQNNPLQYGVNWSCTMDVAIRACNWILGFSYFAQCDLLNYEFKYLFSKNIYFHGIHILKNLEKYPAGPSTNHYLSNLAGLAYIGLFLNKTGFGKKCLGIAIRELKQEMKYQVYADGSDFEASTYYHRLVLELFLYPTIFIAKADEDFNGDNFTKIAVKIFGEDYLGSLRSMVSVIKGVIKNDGTMPQIGDNDSGHLHILGSENSLDAKYILSMGEVFFAESDFEFEEIAYSDEAMWIFGKRAHRYWDKKNIGSYPKDESRIFKDSGWYILKNSSCYMMVSAGPNGQNGFGGHAHNDKLSFELNIDGNDIFIDPGSYLYTPFPQWRNLFRSTASHNTVAVDGCEQNRFTDKSLFLLEDMAKVKINKWASDDEFDFLDAQHFGYMRFADPVLHRRQIYNNKKEDFFIIRDILDGKGLHLFEFNFHLRDDLDYEINKQDKCLVFNIDGKDKYKFWLQKPEHADFKIEDSYLSTGYGLKRQSEILKFSKKTGAPCEFMFIIAKRDYDADIENIEKVIGRFNG